MQFTPDQVLALAPDASSAKSGKDLGVARKWKTLGATEACVWGTIQGSGKAPYQTCIDLKGPAFKCTCPSRKFPCKHGLGLMLVFAQQADAFKEMEVPAWAGEWLAKRAASEEKKTAKASAPAERDPEAEAKAAAAAEKRAASREAQVSAGLEDLQIWLRDLVRTGFASIPGKPFSFWETRAARLVDAQAPGLAQRIRNLYGINTTGERWGEKLLQETALLHLACEGWSRISSLAAETQADLRSVIGFNVSQEEVLARPGVKDRWLVAGQVVFEGDRIKVQRTWLFGSETGRGALCLSFSASPNQPLDITLVPGTSFEGELAFFPGAWPLRALMKQRAGAEQEISPKLPHNTIADALACASEAFSRNAWVERVPFGLNRVVPLRHGNNWVVRDEAGNALPLEITEMRGWSLLAISGGRPIALAGEWNGDVLRPIGVWGEGKHARL